MGVPWIRGGDGRPNLSGDGEVAGTHNARLSAPEHLTQPLDPIAAAAALAVIIDVDALSPPQVPYGDRLLALALGALSHVGVQVLVVARAATPRAVALQRSVAHACWLETEAAVSWLREQQSRGVRTIAVTNDPQLLAALGPEDRGLTLASAPDASHGVMPGEVSMRAVLWWLVARRAVAGGGT